MGITLLLAYACAIVCVGRRSLAAADQTEAFFVNNRSSGAVSVALSIVVSCVGASAAIGMTGTAFSVGTPAFWWLGIGAGGITLLTLLLASHVRASGCLTMPELVGKIFGEPSRILVSLIIVLAWTAILAAQFSALAKMLSAVTGFAPWACRLVGFVLVVLHTRGGQAAILKTDRLQAGILFSGLSVLLLWLTSINPAWPQSSKLEIVNEAFNSSDLLRYCFVIGGNYFVCPMLFGRFLSAKDATAAKRGGFLAVLGLLVAAVLIVMIGLSCRGLVPVETPVDAVLTSALSGVLPYWMAVLVYLTLISAIVSSADSCLVTSATILSHDLLQSENTSRCRGMVLALGAMGLLLTLLERRILDYLLMAYDIYVAGVVMPVFIGLVIPKRRRARPSLIFLSVALGGILGCLAALFGIPAFSIAGMALSTCLALLAFV